MNRWFYLVIGIIVLLMDGLVYAWSVMSKSIGASFPHWTSTQLSFVFTILMIGFCVGCLLAGILSKSVNSKIFVRVGAILYLVGFWIASAAQGTPMLLYIGFSVMCGVSAGLVYNAVLSTIGAWFQDKQGMASGILLMGFGFSSFFVGKLFTVLAPADGGDGWRLTFRMFGTVIFIVFMVCSFFFVKPETGFKLSVSDTKKVRREPAMEASPREMLGQSSFWLYFIWTTLVSSAGLALLAQASGIASQVGADLPYGTIATVVGLISIMNGCGRVFFGSLFDAKGFRFTMMLDIVLFFITFGLLAAAIMTNQFMLIILGFIIGGFAYSCVNPVNAAIISDFFGRKNYAMNFSLINLVLIFASFSSTITERLYDVSQSYMSTIVLMIVLVAVALGVLMFIRRPENT